MSEQTLLHNYRTLDCY